MSEPKGRGAEVSEPTGRDADWTEERGTSDEGRRHHEGGMGRWVGPRRRANLDKEPGDVAAMFDAIAGRYDLMNDLLSAGQVRLWRRAVARIIGVGPGERVLDLAAGTGTSSLSFTATGADCVACDFSLGMLRAGRSRIGDGQRREEGGRLGWAAGDALRLPFRDGAFDAVTISFGLRNVADPGAALTEMRRVTRSGGRLVVCEFSTITIAPVDMIYRRYLINVLPAIARRTARSPEAYEYLAESIADWP